MADAIESGEEIVFALKDRVEADATLAEFGAGEDFGLQFIVLAKEESFANTDLAAGANQAFPIVGLGGKLARE